MRWLPQFVIAMFVGVLASECMAQEVLRPQQATKLADSDQKVTVRFVVQSSHPVLPDGKHFRLVSEPSFRDADAFLVHLTDKVVSQWEGEDLGRRFKGKKIRVTGTVKTMGFSSIAETRPGIRVDDPSLLTIEPDCGAK